MLVVLRPCSIAVWVSVAAALSAAPALAQSAANGSKNFRTPATVPNYFSNEAGPMQGPSSETQRGPLYPSQTATEPAPHVPVAEYRGREHVAMAVPRAVRGHRGAPAPQAHHVAVHGRVPNKVVSRGTGHSHAVQTAHATHAVSRPTHVTTVHHRGRV